MPKAERVRSTPRRITPKIQGTATAGRSPIIEQCVIHLQSKAAFKAGFEADGGNFELAGCHKGQLGARHFKKADQALRKLIGLSPAHVPGSSPLTTAELKSKSAVLKVMEWESIETDLTNDERIYVRFLAQEIEDYLEQVQQ